jgi:hypothetical protein
MGYCVHGGKNILKSWNIWLIWLTNPAITKGESRKQTSTSQQTQQTNKNKTTKDEIINSSSLFNPAMHLRQCSELCAS